MKGRAHAVPCKRRSLSELALNEVFAVRASEARLGQSFKKACTFCLTSVSATCNPAPPSGRVTAPSGLRTLGSGLPEAASAETIPSSAGPLMSDWIALGTFQATHGMRTNVVGENRPCFIDERIFCWRRALVRSFSRGLQRLCRVRASASACLPLMWVLPDFSRSVKPPFLKPPLILETTQPPL